MQQHMLSVEEKESGSLILNEGRFGARQQKTRIDAQSEREDVKSGGISDGLEPSDTIVKTKNALAAPKRSGSAEVSFEVSSALINTVSSALEHFAKSQKQF